MVGDNEPYHGALEGDTLDTHGNRRGLPHALIEIRQDLIAAKSGVDEWVERVARVIEPIMNDPVTARREAGARHEHRRQDPNGTGGGGLSPAAGAPAQRTDVQNIDLMNLAGFCRNCLSNWFEDAAKERGVAVTREEARTMVYGMPYEDWKARYQGEATASQKQAFEKSHKH